MNFKAPLTFIVIFLPFLTNISAQTIDRGPYLQMVTTTSIYIHWRTNSSTDSKVWYGDDPNSLTSTLSVSGNRTDHEIHVTGLTANTTYYYAVGDANGQMVGGDSDHYFKTSPSSNQPVKIWVLGDAGKKNDNQRAVRDAYYGFVGNEHIDMMLLLGDNAYDDGTEDDYQMAWFENMYEDRLINSVMWSTFGNHDGNSADSDTETGPYYDIFNFPRNGQAGGVSSGTEAYYSFDYGNIHIISLNSHDVDDSSNSPMIQWLQDDVNANTKDWTIAMFHHPAYSGSTTAMETNALPILEAAGVDLVLWGHHHRYERSFLINGHYGTPASYDDNTMTIDSGDGRLDGDGAYIKNNNGEGTIFINSGSAGSQSSGSSEHPIMVHNDGLGSVDIEVNDLQMDLKFIDSNGNIDDYFTITKQDGPPSVNITYPLDNDFLPDPETITIMVDATDNGSVSQVEFFIDGTSIGIDYTSPYSWAWTIPSTGSFEIKATATDNDNYTTSKIVNIQVGAGSVCVQVNSSNDDAEEDDIGGISLTSSDLELIQESSDQTVGMRFTNLNIPQDAVINSAFIQFTCDNNTNVNPCVLDIYAEASDDALAFGNSNYNISSRQKTNATASWSPSNWQNVGDAGPAQKTIDISPIIQEVVNRPGFTSNSSIAIIIEGTGKREAESFNGTAAPEICIEFSLDAPLPVELLTFIAQTIGREIKLDWITASEINNDFFTLERSIDGRNFQEIAIIPGKGTSSEINKYNYFDQNPEIGINYYRLKQTDFDGEYSYSNIVNAKIKNENHFLVYPSVVEEIITVEKNINSEEDLTMIIHDLSGRSNKTFTFSSEQNKIELLLTDLLPGIYFLSLYNDKTIESFKFIKL